MDESFPPPEEPYELTEDERADIAADLDDLGRCTRSSRSQGSRAS